MDRLTLWVLIVCLLGPFACGRPQPRAFVASDPSLHVLSWTGHGAHEDPQGAAYRFDGRAVGRGSQGFKRVLALVRALPERSRVVMIYDEPSGWDSGPLYILPFANFWDDIDALEQDRGTVLLGTASPEAKRVLDAVKGGTLRLEASMDAKIRSGKISLSGEESGHDGGH